MKRIGIIAVISLLIDQLVKLIVVSNMKVFDSVEVISNFFRITYLQNTGGAFSLFSTNTVFLICLTSVILFVFILFISKQKEFTKSDIWIYGMLIGGILGNFIDRVRLGYVVDFFDFNFGSYHYPVFNVADIFIVISCLILIIKIGKEDFNAVGSKRRKTS